ncbi:hypothetical protein CFP56_023654 [Quercus suber]|uniref:Uncharacterized protein n=1 Tax=Quercus suber TaxID=58331 RepID=A0AAW0LZ13_QUESU
MLGATISIALPSSSSHAFIACIILNLGTLNHFISDSSFAYRGITPILDTFDESDPTGDPPAIISNGFIPICMSANIAYLFVIANSCKKEGRRKHYEISQYLTLGH